MRTVKIVVICVVGFLASGCVSMSKYKSLQKQYTDLSAKNNACQKTSAELSEVLAGTQTKLVKSIQDNKALNDWAHAWERNKRQVVEHAEKHPK